jgi:DNA uptake protein ComE-like DNA-binding protein
MGITSNGWWWKLRNSKWVLCAAIPGGIFTWIAFLLIGREVKEKKWLICSVVYGMFAVIEVILAANNVPGRGVPAFIIWIGGLVHALCVRPAYLRKLEVLNNKPMPTLLSQVSLEPSVDAEQRPDIYLFVNDQQIGPFTLTAIRQMLASGTIKPSTQAWKAGLDQWTAVEALIGEDFNAVLNRYRPTLSGSKNTFLFPNIPIEILVRMQKICGVPESELNDAPILLRSVTNRSLGWYVTTTNIYAKPIWKSPISFKLDSISIGDGPFGTPKIVGTTIQLPTGLLLKSKNGPLADCLRDIAACALQRGNESLAVRQSVENPSLESISGTASREFSIGTESNILQNLNSPAYSSADGIEPLVDINTASEDAIAALPGLGVALAKRIVLIRQQEGGFHSLEVLVAKLHMKSHIAERLRSLIQFSEVSSRSSLTSPRGRIVDF